MFRPVTIYPFHILKEHIFPPAIIYDRENISPNQIRCSSIVLERKVACSARLFIGHILFIFDTLLTNMTSSTRAFS